jgi:hypothetical protein
MNDIYKILATLNNLESKQLTEGAYDQYDLGTDEDDYEEGNEGFFVCIGSEDEGGFIGMVTKDGGKWREVAMKGNAPYNWGGSYMSYLSPQDVMQHIRNDYGRHADVKGPFSDEESAVRYAQMNYDLEESSMTSAQQHKSGAKFGGYWKGTDKGTPKPGQGVGGMEESVEQEIREGYNSYLAELGANNGPASTNISTAAAPAPATATPTANTQQDAEKIKQSLQAMKSKVPNLDVNKATQALTKTDAEQPLGSTDQQALAGMAAPLADVAKNPQLAGQLTQLFNKGLQTTAAAKKAAPQTPGVQ